MGIPLFKPRFETNLLRPFYEGLEKGELHLTACAACGTWHWYPPEVLPCHPDAALVWRPVSAAGTVYTFTTVHRCLLPGDHSRETPYTIVVVEPDDVPGARIPSLFIDAGEEQPACGMRVKLSPVKAGEITLPAFTPIAGAVGS